MLLTVVLLAQISAEPMQALPVEPIVRSRLLAEAHRVWEPESGRAMVLIPWAIAIDGGFRRDEDFAVVPRLRITPRGEKRIEVKGAAQRVSRSATHLVGHFLTPQPAGPAEWTVEPTFPGRRRHRDATSTGALEPLGTGPLVLSDIVVGAASHGLHIDLGADAVPLAPRQAVQRGEPLSFFVQVRAAEEMLGGHLSLSVSRVIGGVVEGTKAFRLSETLDITPGLAALQREVDVGRLVGDRYLFTVELTSADGVVRAERTTCFELMDDLGVAGEGVGPALSP